jgi:hypothetical protein
MRSTNERGKSRPRRVLRGLGKALGYGLLGLLALLVVLLACVNLPFARAFVATRANAALSESFRGRVVIERIGAIRLDGVAGVDARLFDAAGKQVLDARGLSVALPWPRLLWQLVVEKPESATIVIQRVSLAHADVALRDDGSGAPTLSTVFEPREPSPPSPGPPALVVVEAIELQHAWLHGTLGGAPAIDAELRTVAGRLRLGGPNAERDAALSLRGRVMGSTLSADAAIARDRVRALVHVVAPPEAVTRFVPSLSPQGSSALVFKAQGLLSGQLQLEARLQSPGGRSLATARLRLVPELEATLHVEADDLNASGLAPNLPESDVHLVLDADAKTVKGAVQGDYRLKVRPGRVAAQNTPALHVDGEFAQRRDGALRTRGELRVHEPGAATRVDYQLGYDAPSQFEARSRTELEHPARLRELAELTIDGEVEARVRYDLERQNLAFEVLANVPELYASGRRFSRVALRAEGDEQRARVEASAIASAGRRLSASSSIQFEPLTLSDSRLRAVHGKTTVDARVAEVTWGDELRVRGLVLEGTGRAEASLTYGRRLERLDVRTTDLDVPRLMGVLGLQPPLERATLSVTAQFQRRGGVPQGYLRGRVSELAVARSGQGSLDLDLALARGRTNGSVAFALAPGGHGVVTVEDVPLLEPPYTSAALQRLRGRVAVDAELELGALDTWIARGVVPLEQASGNVELNVSVSRSKAGKGLPDVAGSVKTRDLELVGKRRPLPPEPSAEEARQAEPWALRALDLATQIELQGDRGELAVDLQASDRHGELLRLEAQTTLPKTLGERIDFQRLPLQARVELPTRAIEKLPDALPIDGIEGNIAFELDVRGTLRQPRAEIAGRLDAVRPRGSSTAPLDVLYRGWIDREGGQISVDGFALGRRVATARSAWQGDVMAGGRGVLGRALLEVDHMPLSLIPGTALGQVDGVLSGRVALDGFGQDARLRGKLDAERIRLGTAHFRALHADLDVHGGALNAKLKVEQADGSVEGKLEAACAWGAAPLPRVAQPFEATARAHNFRLAGLALLAPSVLDELDGRLDAELKAHFAKGPPDLRGQIVIRDGVLQEPTIGQRFHDIEAKVVLAPDAVRLERMSARGSSGRLNAKAIARLDGMSLREAEVDVWVKKNEMIPVGFQGVTLGDAYGKISAKVRGNEISVMIPELGVEIPDSGGPSVQELEPADYVRVGTIQESQGFVVLPLQPLMEHSAAKAGPPTIVRIKLGPKARLRKGTQYDVELGGELVMRLGNETDIDGEVRATRGKLDLRGKLFDIDRAIVTFDGQDPANPMVVATARWNSPAGYTVLVEYSGTVSQGQLTLSSEPPLTQDQVLSLILFGNADGSAGGGSNDSASAALGVVGSPATRGINRALSKVTDLEIDARIDTSTGSSRPELVMQITPRLSARLTRALGDPAPGQAPDRTFATLDMRLSGRWSLATTVGDRGASALDLLWRKRY